MQVTGVATKTAMLTAQRDVVADGSLEILSASSQVLAVIGLSTTGGTISGLSSVVWTLAFDSSGETLGLSAAGAGTNAASARLKTLGGVVQETLTLTAAGGGGDIQLDNISISYNQTVKITAGAITWP